MDHDTLIAVFVVIAAISIVIQMLVLLGAYLAARKIGREIAQRGEESKRILDNLHKVLETFASSAEAIKTLTVNAADLSRIIRERAAVLDEVVGEAAERGRGQIHRIDLLLSSLAERVDSTAAEIQRSVLAPVNEIAAIRKAIRVAVDFFLSKRQPSSVREATQDEEMFI